MGNTKVQAASKPMLMLMLSTVIILKARGKTGAMIAIPLLFGMIGDIILLKPEGKRFLLGAGSFLVEHLCWIFIYMRAGVFIQLPMLFIIPTIAVYIVFLGILFFLIGKPQGGMGIGILIYGAILCALHFTSLASFFRLPLSHSLLIPPLFFIGSTLFLISDTMLGLSVCREPFPKSDFFIMGTYIAAQVLIAVAALHLGAIF